jgi:hypothetical protein
MKPNMPVPVSQPMVVATALPSATTVKILPWIRSSHRRKAAIPGVAKRLAFIAIFLRRPSSASIADANGHDMSLNLAVHSTPSEALGDGFGRDIGRLSESCGVAGLDLAS